MLLAQNEKIIKEWTYGKVEKGSGLGKKVSEYQLIVTNKRLVSSIVSKGAQSIDQIKIEDIENVQLSSFAKSNFGAIVKIIFGILLLFFIVGIPLLIRGIKELKQGSFNMVVYTNKEMYEAFYVTMYRIIRKKKSKNKKLKVLVDKNVAYEIVDSLGAIIMDLQDPNFKPVSNETLKVEVKK